MVSPLAWQTLVAGSTHLAALSAGGVIAYPSILLQQFKLNDTIIHVDLHTGSWIGSVHGLAGIPSVLMPLLMQYRGRKLAFILSCIFIIIGWVLIYAARDVTMILIGESFHGIGGNSLLSVSFLGVAEMVQPKYRNTCLSLYGTSQAFGISTVGVLGQYLHWKTVSWIVSIPVLLALPIGFTWPESPSWLAWKGKLEECQRVFVRLRGTDEASRKELKAIIDSQQQTKTEQCIMQKLRNLRGSMMKRDFYVPALHSVILLNVLYWGGGMPVIIYSNDMFIKASGKPNVQMKLFMDISLFVGYCTSSALVGYCSTKKLLVLSLIGSGIFMTAASGITYMQFMGILPKDSELAVYCLAAFFVVMCLGMNSLGFCISSEIMPVKYRGIGGSLFLILTCMYHSSSLKAYPYLCIYVNIWGVFLIYGLYTFMSAIIIWKYVPETRNRTLQEIEEFYIFGHFKDDDKDDVVRVPFIKSEIK